jgi:hypothetical protein
MAVDGEGFPASPRFSGIHYYYIFIQETLNSKKE